MIFLTTSDFQKGAIEKAKSRNVELYKISQEQIENNDQFGIKNIFIIEKQCKILSVRFDSEELFKNNIFPNEKLSFYNKNEKQINQEDFRQKLIELPDIWKFLNTKSGVLLNQKKIIYPNLKSENIFTKYQDKFYPIDIMTFSLEIELSYKPLDLGIVKKYQSLTENTTLALFSDLEFISNGIKHRFCYVKPVDEDEGRFFVSSNNSNETLELKVLGSIDMDSKPSEISKSKLKNVKISIYEFNMTQEAVDNSLNNIPIAPKETNSKFLNELKTKKSSILVGIDENKRKLFFMIPLSHNKKLITAKFPEPISLYLNHSIELYKKSKSYRDILVLNSTEDETLYLQDDSSHKYMQYTISSIFMLHSSIELFINSCIKDNFEFDFEGKTLKKQEIENELTLSEKVELIIPLISSFNSKSNKKIIGILVELSELNNELQNLKTSDSTDQPFLETFEMMLNFDMESCFDSVKKFFKKVNKNYELNEL